MNERDLAQGFLKLITAAAFLGAVATIFTAYLDAADCPVGQVAVRNVWNWPVCIAGAQP